MARTCLPNSADTSFNERWSGNFEVYTIYNIHVLILIGSKVMTKMQPEIASTLG